MSYRSYYFLTVGLLLVWCAGVASAQRDIVRNELDVLAAPAAWQRAEAINRLAGLKQDIGPDLRVAWKIVETQQRIGLLEVARIRESSALLQQAAVALAGEDETLAGIARDYLMTLAVDELKPEMSELTPTQAEAWKAFFTLRIRRDIAHVLLDAQMMPGKFFGQFDQLRRIDSRRLDAELLSILRCDLEQTEALNLASIEATGNDAPAERAFDANWRKLQIATGAFGPALMYLRDMDKTEAVQAAIKSQPRSAFLAALEVSSGVRAAAVRALAQSDAVDEMRLALDDYYRVLMKQQPDGEYANVLVPDDLRQEIELTLARFGDDALLQARIATLRAQIEHTENVRSNVNMAASSRPDLTVQNQIAHLLLRSGDFEGAEKEWAAGVETALVMLRNSDGRNRSSLASYLAAVYYNLACTQSLQLELSKSLHSLKEAVRYGYKDFSWMLEDGDLRNARAFDGFSDWFEDAAPPSIADRLAADS